MFVIFIRLYLYYGFNDERRFLATKKEAAEGKRGPRGLVAGPAAEAARRGGGRARGRPGAVEGVEDCLQDGDTLAVVVVGYIFKGT